MTARLLFFIFFIVALALTGCASVTGYDPKRYEESVKEKPDADVDTEALAPAPRRTIPDPRRPLARDASP
jgi:hypothetical protein